VLIPGYYDGITLTEEEKELINDMPGSDTDLNERLGIAKPDGVGATYEESLQYPSLNVRGLKAASVDKEVRTIIPSEAIAELDLRLVPETDGEKQVQLIKKYIEAQGYHFVNDAPTQQERANYPNLISFEYRLGSKPFRTDLNSAEGKWLASAMDKTFGMGKYVKQRTSGGSQPIESFITTLTIPAVSLRIPNPDNNIHAANENLRIGNFIEGIQMCLGILTQPLKQ
jgi:acetylornithine deacetylase/succinyl-diaminopimelate desuccinylase-like protein